MIEIKNYGYGVGEAGAALVEDLKTLWAWDYYETVETGASISCWGSFTSGWTRVQYYLYNNGTDMTGGGYILEVAYRPSYREIITRIGYNDGTNTIYKAYGKYIDFTSSYSSQAVIASDVYGFCVMLGSSDLSTQTNISYQPLYFGLYPAVNARTQENGTALFSSLTPDFNSNSGVHSRSIAVASPWIQDTDRTGYCTQYNQSGGALTAIPVYDSFHDFGVIHDIKLLQAIPDGYFCRVCDVEWNGTPYYRMGHLLFPRT